MVIDRFAYVEIVDSKGNKRIWNDNDYSLTIVTERKSNTFGHICQMDGKSVAFGIKDDVRQSDIASAVAQRVISPMTDSVYRWMRE